MKMKKTGCKIIVFSLILIFSFSFSAFTFSSFSVHAVPADEEVVEENPEEEDPEGLNDDVDDPEEDPEEPVETEEPAVETQETEAKPQETEAQPEETEPQYEETEEVPEETYAVLDNDMEDLPEADTAPHPTAPRTKKADQAADMTYGFFSWACVIVGVLTVIIVILSNKSGYYGGSGKQRYDEGNKITGQKRLLSDDYYTTRKYNNYQDRDNYR